MGWARDMNGRERLTKRADALRVKGFGEWRKRARVGWRTRASEGKGGGERGRGWGAPVYLRKSNHPY